MPKLYNTEAWIGRCNTTTQKSLTKSDIADVSKHFVRKLIRLNILATSVDFLKLYPERMPLMCLIFCNSRVSFERITARRSIRDDVSICLFD